MRQQTVLEVPKARAPAGDDGLRKDVHGDGGAVQPQRAPTGHGHGELQEGGDPLGPELRRGQLEAHRERLRGGQTLRERTVIAGGRVALEGEGPQKRLDRRLEEVAKAVGGGYCRIVRHSLGPCCLLLLLPPNLKGRGAGGPGIPGTTAGQWRSRTAGAQSH